MAIADLIKPRLTGLDLQLIDVRTGQARASFSAVALDDGSGVESVTIGLDRSFLSGFGLTNVISLTDRGDRDWYGISLRAGETVTLDLAGAGLADPLLSLFDASGRRIAIDDNGGPGLDAAIRYTAGAAGTYYVVAKGADPAVGAGYSLLIDSDMMI